MTVSFALLLALRRLQSVTVKSGNRKGLCELNTHLDPTFRYAHMHTRMNAHMFMHFQTSNLPSTSTQLLACAHKYTVYIIHYMHIFPSIHGHNRCTHTHACTHFSVHTLTLKGIHWPHCMWVRSMQSYIDFSAVCLTVCRHVKKADY